MANLLSWNGGLNLQRKKNELTTTTPLISSLRTMSVTPARTSSALNQNRTTGTKSSILSFANAAQQQNDLIRQQAEQRRQQEEQQRQQRIAEAQRQQEQRKQQEQAKKLQEQQVQQQKQQRLLNSSLTGQSILSGSSVGDRRSGMSQNSNRSLLSTLGAQNNLDRRLNPVKSESDLKYDKWLSTTSMDDLSKELDKARADNNTDWIRRIQQYSGKSTKDIDTYKKQVGVQNSELNLGRSAATTLRDVSDTKTYDNIDVNDSDNVRYFGRQNLLKKALKSALGDNADVSKMSYRDVIDTYNNASGDQQADIKKAIADEIVNQREYAKKGNQESLKSVSYLADLNALLNEYGTDKGKSFGKQIGDWLSTGGFIGNIGGNALTEALGNMTGTEDATKAYLEKQQNKRTDLGAVGAVDTALTGISNTALNLGTGGWYGLANAGVNTANTINGLDDKVLDFDDYGRASLRGKEQGEQLSELGSTAINDLFAVAGKAGVGPGLGSGSIKDIAKYAWQEPLWAGGTTLAQEGFSNLGKGKEFGDYDWENVGKSFAANLGQDIGMDLFNLGRTRAQMKINSQGENGYLQKGLQQDNDNVRTLEDGTMVKINVDGTVSRLTDAELAKVITDDMNNKRATQQANGPVDNNMDGVISGKSRKGLGEVVDDAYSKLVNRKAVDRLANGIENGTDRDIRFARMSKEQLAKNNEIQNARGEQPFTKRQVTAYKNAVNNNLNNRYVENPDVMTSRKVAEIAYDSIMNPQSEVLPGKGRNTVNVSRYSDDSYNGSVLGRAQDGGTSLKSIEPRNQKEVGKMRQQKSDLLGQSGSPLMGTSEGGVTRHRTVNSADSVTSLGDSRAVSAADPSRVLDSSISQKAKKVQSGVAKLADLSYDVSDKVTSKAKKVAKKAADIANEHPLGGTTKLMNLSGLEDSDSGNLKSDYKMTTQEFFDANKIGSNDLEALKHNYPKEVQSVKKLIKAGVTPETFNSKVMNSDGTVKSAYKYQEIPAMRGIFEMTYNYNKMTDVGSTKDQKRANLFGEETVKANTMAESSLAKNMSNNMAFSEETRNALANDPVEYKPATNEERLARANEILSSKSFDEVDSYLRDNYFNTADKNRNSGDTVLAGEFAKMLDADGQYGRATEIVQKMSEIATKQGQQIQALSIMSNRSPEGIANMAQTAIQKGGGKVDGEIRKQILTNTQEIGRIRAKMAELNSENSDISYKIMSGEGDLPALRKRQMEIGQEYRACLDQEGRDFAKLSEMVSNNSPRDKSIFGSVWRAGLLSGPRTHVGNAVSNTFQNALNASADRIASGLDWARTKITGGEREVVASAGGRSKGLKRGLKAAGEVMKTGTNLWEGTEKVTSGQGANAWGHGGELEFKNKIADTMVAKPTNYVFRAMSAGDLPFRYSAFENAIRTEAKRQGMNQGYKGQALQDYINSRVATPDPDLQAYGIKKGNEAVYDSDTFLSRAMSSLDKQINKIDNKFGRNAAKTAKTLIAPFVKVPSKVLSTAVDYSPVGAVQAVVKKVGGSKNYSVGQFETDIAKSGLGTTAFVGLGYALSSAGLLTGGYPEEQKERDRWKAEGIEPNSVKIGDKYVSLNYLGPAAILMGMGAGVQQRQEKGQDPFTIAVGSIGDTFNAFFEQSYVQGLNSAINAVKDSQRYGESYANSLARGLVPNLLRQTAVATDSKQRQVDNPLEAITSGIPGLSQTLDAKVDVYGREIENKQTLPLGQMWDALKISNSRETNAVIDEINRLHNIDPSNGDLQVTPPQAQSSVSVDGVSVKLTDNQKTQLQKDIGAAALEAMQQVISSSQYQSLSDEEKAKALDKARSDAQKQVRKQFIEANNITADNNPGTRESGGVASGDFASRAIASATKADGKNAITPNSSISNDSKSVFERYNSMTSDDWNDYLYGTSAEAAAAEYKLALAKYENDLANDKLTEPQRIKREKELAKLAVSQKWTKDYRDAYSLAGTKADMQAFLNELDDETRAQTVATLNGLNNAMYEAGIITASTYKTRANAINNTVSKKSSGGRKSSSSKSKDGMTSAEASALSSLAKTLASADDDVKVKTTSAPTTNRKMNRRKSGGSKSGLATYSPSLAKTVSVSSGAKRSIA